MQTNNVLQFTPKGRRYMRAYRRNFNYFAPMFYVSLSFNILFFTLLICKSLVR